MEDSNTTGKRIVRAFFRTYHSIRTRYSLATAAFLLLILAMFYVGGRIVLVHLVRDTERQVQSIGFAVSNFVKMDVQHIHDTASKVVKLYDVYDPQTTARLIGPHENLNIALALHLNTRGQFAGGHVAGTDGHTPVLVDENDLDPYTPTFARWAQTRDVTNAVRSAGLIRVRGQSYHSAIVRHGTQFLVLGTPFNIDAFAVRMNESLGHPIRITATSRGDAPSAMIVKRAVPQPVPSTRFSYGLSPMLSEAIHFYSGGFWRFEGDPIEAAFTLRDIAGHSIAQIAVSLPKSFANITSIALDRLTFCIALIGLLLIVPIFWLQCHAILNPLSEMIARIREVRDHRKEVDCPRIDWKGEDEFAQLADCVNALLETISRRTVDVEQSAKRQRALIDGIPDGLLIFDSKCRLVHAFKHPEGVQPIPGLSEREGLNPDVWNERNTMAFNQLIKRCFADKSRHGVILKIPAPEKDDETATRNFDIRAVPMDAHFALVVFRDVTAEAREERRRLSELERDSQYRKQESLSALAAGIAHDVNNILSIVLNTTEITWQEQQTEQNQKAVATIRDAVKRGCDMMRELMTFAGEARTTLRPVEPTDLIRGAESLARAVIGPQIELNIDVPYGLPSVDADPSQMWKVFFNIIKNARESLSDEPGIIHVTAARYIMLERVAETFESSNPLPPGPGIIFRISDNGPGIPPDVQRRLFDPYISTKGTGRGLGLAISYATVDAHGGGIRVRSILGHGTTFEVFLPLSRPVSPVLPKPAASTDVARTDSTHKDILIVDDDPNILRTTTVLLKLLKYSGHVAGDRHTALLKFRKLAPTLAGVILDAHLASFSTTRVLQAMRLIAPHVPVIVTSGSSEQITAKIFEDAPYNAFLAKPYTSDELKDALTRASTPIA